MAGYKWGIHGKKKPDVEAYEEEQGGVKSKALSQPPTRYWHYDTKEEEHPLVARCYKFYTHSDAPENLPPDDPFVYQVRELYGHYFDVNMALWKFEGEWRLTKEVKAFFKKHNVVLQKEQHDHFFFYSHEHKVGFTLASIAFGNSQQGRRLLVFRGYRQVEEAEQQTSVQLFIDSERYFEYLYEQNKELERQYDGIMLQNN